jgi:hypothetical protein
MTSIAATSTPSGLHVLLAAFILPHSDPDTSGHGRLKRSLPPPGRQPVVFKCASIIPELAMLFYADKSTARDISVHVHGDSAWAEFYWHFDAKQRSNESPVQTDGGETQLYTRWRGTAGRSPMCTTRVCRPVNDRNRIRIKRGRTC